MSKTVTGRKVSKISLYNRNCLVYASSLSLKVDDPAFQKRALLRLVVGWAEEGLTAV